MITCNLQELIIPYDPDKLMSEFNYFKNKKIDISKSQIEASKMNYIVKYFQQDEFYKEEKELWQSSRDLRDHMIANRCYYLNKNQDELTEIEILNGFKIMALHYGYSHFNPFWFKYFIDKYNIKTVYDPCGGWGHRLLGGLNLEKYIYNDLSIKTKENVDKIVKYFKLSHVKTYCQDAQNFIPDDSFEAMFTCPPYFNLEHYSCGDFLNEAEYIKFVDKLFDIFNSRSDCRIFGLVTREDMIYNHTNYSEKYILNKLYSHLAKRKKKNEYLFIYKK